MKTIDFSTNELSLIRRAFAYVDCCLEDLPLGMNGWTTKHFLDAFYAVSEKYSHSKSPFSLTNDDIIATSTALYHYLFTAQPFDMPRSLPEDGAEVSELRTKILFLLSDAPADENSR